MFFGEILERLSKCVRLTVLNSLRFTFPTVCHIQFCVNLKKQNVTLMGVCETDSFQIEVVKLMFAY